MRTTIVHAPHPDDEVLYLGAYVTVARRRGDRLILNAVTDGDGSVVRPDDWTVDDLVRVRRAEQFRAWQLLTGGTGEIMRMGLPDGRVTPHPVSVLTTALDRIYGVDLEHYVAGSSLPSESSDHRAVAAGVLGGSRRTVRFARSPLDPVGGSYRPADLPAVTSAAAAYAAFGQRSAPTMFAALRANGYVSRVFL